MKESDFKSFFLPIKIFISKFACRRFRICSTLTFCHKTYIINK